MCLVEPVQILLVLLAAILAVGFIALGWRRWEERRAQRLFEAQVRAITDALRGRLP